MPDLHSHPLARRIAAAVVAVMMVAAAWPATPARAASDSNIPGVPLPSDYVVNTLGGPIYDRVYSMSVPPASVILLSLTGDPGTDFDLYLFDSSATTVYGTQGQVASSTSDTSTESITYGSIGGGKYYVDVAGFSNTEGDFYLHVAVAADTTPPNAKLRLDNGAPATQDSTVQATVVATDDLSGVNAMQFSTDGTTWGAWRQYAPIVLWPFPPGDGVKTLWVRVRDAAGNVSKVASASITVDTVAPVVTARSPGPEGSTDGLLGTFSVTFSEPIDPATWTNQGLVVQSPDGTTVLGTYAYDAATNTGTFTPSVYMTAGATYVVTIGAVTDLAGNPLAPLGSWVVTALAARNLSLTISPRTILPGESVRAEAHIDPPLATPLLLDESVAGGPWTLVGSPGADAQGDVVLTLAPDANTTYRLRTQASATEAAATSPAVRVLVRRGLAFRGISSTVTRVTSPGALVSLRAIVTPAEPKVVVSVGIYRYDGASHRYLKVGTINRTTVHGVAAVAWYPSTAGSYYLRLTTSPTHEFANGISAAYRWKVR